MRLGDTARRFMEVELGDATTVYTSRAAGVLGLSSALSAGAAERWRNGLYQVGASS